MEAIIKDIEKRMPSASILLLGVLPRIGKALDTEVHDVNLLLAKMEDKKKVHYVDMTIDFETALGKEREKLYTPDHVHLVHAGYEQWYTIMEPHFAKLLA